MRKNIMQKVAMLAVLAIVVYSCAKIFLKHSLTVV